MTDSSRSQRIKQFSSIAEKHLGKDGEMVLKQNSVSVDQYVAWVLKKYRDLGPKIGMVLAFIIPWIVFGGFAYVDVFDLVVNVVICLGIFVGFLLAAVLSRYVLTSSWQQSALESPYLDTVVMQASDLNKINKISQSEWANISAFDHNAYWEGSDEKNMARFDEETIDRLSKWVSVFDKWMWRALILMTVAVVVFFVVPEGFKESSSWFYGVFAGIIMIGFLAMGCRYFFGSLLGYGKRVLRLNLIGLPSAKMRLTGKMATFISIVFMIIWGPGVLFMIGVLVWLLWGYLWV